MEEEGKLRSSMGARLSYKSWREGASFCLEIVLIGQLEGCTDLLKGCVLGEEVKTALQLNVTDWKFPLYIRRRHFLDFPRVLRCR